jgi:hypothetical protein
MREWSRGRAGDDGTVATRWRSALSDSVVRWSVPSRSALVLAASFLAGVAAVVSGLDGDADLVPFFVGLTFVGGIGAWAVGAPFIGPRKALARIIGAVWLVAAGWIGGLLLWFQAACGCSGPPPSPEATYLGLTATVFHVTAVFLGGALMAVAAFGPSLADKRISAGE